MYSGSINLFGSLFANALFVIRLFSCRVRFQMREWVVDALAFVASDRRRTRLGKMASFEASEADAQVFVEFPAVRRVHLAVSGAAR